MNGQRVKRKTANGDEEDVFTGWRKLYCWTQRPGATSRVKRAARRRERFEARHEARFERFDDAAE